MTAGLVLAAGAASRFGSPKSLAALDGRPMLEHVLDVARAARLAPVVVVLGVAGEAVEAGIDWSGELRVHNPDPDRGLASSLRLGLAAIEQAASTEDATVILLGDQPRTDPALIGRLIGAPATALRPIVAPRYAGGGGPNPLLLHRSAYSLARLAEGDRGFGPVLAAHPELVTWVEVPGTNPDVDTPADLAGAERGTASGTA
ncbi:MAG TPA: nucleotidyltransferase family protein [Candidatus Limnocylindrales bacterium]